MDQHWEALYLAAKKALNPRVISKFVEAGGVAAAVETVAHGFAVDYSLGGLLSGEG